jgi:hypothetical protein
MLGALIRNLYANDMLDVKPPYEGLSLTKAIRSVKACIAPHWKEAGLEDRNAGPYTHHSCRFSSFSSLFGDLTYQVSGLDLHRFRQWCVRYIQHSWLNANCFGS